MQNSMMLQRIISKAKTIAMGFGATTTTLIILAMGGLTVELVPVDEDDEMCRE